MPNWQDVIQRANSDSAFRERLKANPAAACQEAGCPVQAGAAVVVIEDRDDELHIFLGSRPQSAELRSLVDKACQDQAFKGRLLADPRRGFEEATGETLPAHIKVRVHDKSPGRTVLLLSRSAAEQELSEHELATVAGGTLKGLLKKIGGGIRDLMCRDTPTGTIGANTDAGGQVTGVSVEFNTSPGTETVQY